MTVEVRTSGMFADGQVTPEEDSEKARNGRKSSEGGSSRSASKGSTSAKSTRSSGSKA